MPKISKKNLEDEIIEEFKKNAIEKQDIVEYDDNGKDKNNINLSINEEKNINISKCILEIYNEILFYSKNQQLPINEYLDLENVSNYIKWILER